MASLVLGWLGAAKRVESRVKKLEEQFATFEKTVDERIKAQGSATDHDSKRITTIARAVDSLRSGVRLELNSFKSDILLRVVQLERDLKDMNDDLSKLTDSSTDFAKDAELAQFIGEQHERWERINRTLGELVGEIRAHQQNQTRR